MRKSFSILLLALTLSGCAVAPTQFDTSVLEIDPERPIGFYYDDQVTLDDMVDETGGYLAAGLIGLAVTAVINAGAQRQHDDYFDQLEADFDEAGYSDLAYDNHRSYIESGQFPVHASLQAVDSPGIKGEGALLSVAHGFSSNLDRFRMVLQYKTRTETEEVAGVGNPDKATKVGNYKIRTYLALFGPDSEAQSRAGNEAYWQKNESEAVKQAMVKGIELLTGLFRKDVSGQLVVPPDTESIRFSEGRFLLDGNIVSDSDGIWTVECSNVDLGICYAMLPGHLEYVPPEELGEVEDRQ